MVCFCSILVMIVEWLVGGSDRYVLVLLYVYLICILDFFVMCIIVVLCDR